MAEDRSKFNTGNFKSESFNQLVKKPKKKVEISGENEYGNDAFNTAPSGLASYTTPKEMPGAEPKIKRKQGRPKVITDDRYKVSLPKKISPALENKLKQLKDAMPEFQEVSGRISFNQIVDTLAESYIKNRLPMSKEEYIRSQIENGFDKLKKS
ncbi:hypothetical protein FC83_GL001386 [Agrilactobacillus composti DSM 18527 = JCM 14202]|uniref:Uncharacterized protein n=1 Tax=Agrilactobacillus composti DSM 18527 = JCM 14202 TaxID=1423734 RepID=X0PE81_9LACO|nr:hypothetical protein [Agrilactobacillus composti]KRM30828.1 hypothetical protein FC83_GL001386 [Agrilactobacillus composti DSM 18527 = JCM 14202]GAF39829.1 hypothetical protein JCM14202_1705 [Agrilactobacillus composti DSM 18527 = JCM 14202]